MVLIPNEALTSLPLHREIMRDRIQTQQTQPNIIGTAGGSVGTMSGSFGGRAAIGKIGEVRTAEVLARLCRGDGPTVLHDLRLPMGKMQANIDHVVVSGERVTILDSKAWQPGRIWTFAGVTRRGWSRFPSGDKRTLDMAQTAISAVLRGKQVKHRMATPLMVVWPSNDTRAMKLGLFKPVGAEAITGRRLITNAKKLLGDKPADPAIVAALLPLVIKTGGQIIGGGRQPLAIDDDPFA